jgi:hypothetical protein
VFGDVSNWKFQTVAHAYRQLSASSFSTITLVRIADSVIRLCSIQATQE